MCVSATKPPGITAEASGIIQLITHILRVCSVEENVNTESF